MNPLIRAFLVRVAFRVACMFALLCACTASPAQPATNEVQTAFYEILGALDANQFAQFADALNLSDKAAVSNVVNWLRIRDQIVALQSNVRVFEVQLAEKQQALTNLQRKVDLLKLTPKQLALVESYNRSVSHDPTFNEWITEHQTWFEIGKDVLIAVVFLLIGLWIEQWRAKTKRRRQ